MYFFKDLGNHENYIVSRVKQRMTLFEITQHVIVRQSKFLI